MSHPIAKVACVGLVLASILLGLSGCKETPKVGSETPPVVAATMSFGTADEIDVNWRGAWWKAEVLSIEGDKYNVHYIGWSSTWDDTVTADRVRWRTVESKTGPGVPVAPETRPVAAAFNVGSKVDVDWNGAWHEGRIIGTAPDLFRVHYTGFDASRDENVPANRLRAWTGSAKKGPGPS